MESTSTENRIRALFSELKLEDEGAAPRFASVWSQARARRTASRSTFKFARATLALTAGAVLCALVLLSARALRSRQPTDILANGSKTQETTPLIIKQQPQPSGLPSRRGRQRFIAKQGSVRLNGRRDWARRARRSLETEAMAIGRWQSPTANLLHSYNERLLNALPPMNETPRELKSFLPLSN
jgi:hypothetical protein